MTGYKPEILDDYVAPLPEDLDVFGPNLLVAACLLIQAENPTWMNVSELQANVQRYCSPFTPKKMPESKELIMARAALIHDVGMLSVRGGGPPEEQESIINDGGMLRGLPLAGVILGRENVAQNVNLRTLLQEREMTFSQFMDYYRHAASHESGLAYDLPLGMRGFLANVISLEGSKSRQRYAQEASNLMAKPEHFVRIFDPQHESIKVLKSTTTAKITAKNEMPADETFLKAIPKAIDAIGNYPLAMACLLVANAHQTDWFNAKEMSEMLIEQTGGWKSRKLIPSLVSRALHKISRGGLYCDEKADDNKDRYIRINEAGTAYALPTIGAIVGWHLDMNMPHAEIFGNGVRTMATYIDIFAQIIEKGELSDPRALRAPTRIAAIQHLKSRGTIHVRYAEGSGSRKIEAVWLAEQFREPVAELVRCVLALKTEDGRKAAAIRAQEIFNNPKDFTQLFGAD